MKYLRLKCFREDIIGMKYNKKNITKKIEKMFPKEIWVRKLVWKNNVEQYYYFLKFSVRKGIFNIYIISEENEELYITQLFSSDNNPEILKEKWFKSEPDEKKKVEIIQSRCKFSWELCQRRKL